MEPLVQVRRVSKRYGTNGKGRAALDAIDLDIAVGVFLAVMGPSGSGKSTLLNVIGGLDRTYDGSVRVDGAALERQDDNQLAELRRHAFGFVFQAFNLIPVLSAAENVALPGLIAGRAGGVERAVELLELFGCGELRDRRPSELSGGEQQRVAIARALFLEPKILLADEPTGNLDSASGTAVLELLTKVREELGTTVVMVTHDAAAAARSSHVLTLCDGSATGQLEFARDEPWSDRALRLSAWLTQTAGKAPARTRPPSRTRRRPLVSP